jgi:hypothetical protein
MSVKRILLFAAMTLGLITSVGPATASATEYGLYHVGVGTLSKHTEIPLTGKVKFKTMSTGMECQVDATITTQTGVSANTKLSKYEITTSTCAGFGSLYEGCEMSKDTITGLSWSSEVKEKSLNVLEVEVDTKNKAKAGKECFPTTTNLNFSTLTLTPNAAGKIETLTVSGTGTAETNVGNLSISAEGTLEVTGASKGTYGIETIVSSGLTIKDAGKELESKEIPFEGKAKFEALGTGIECNITTKILVNLKTVAVKSFLVTNPTTECTFFGSVYKECAFEEHPSGLINGPLDVDLSTDAGGEHTATVTAGTDSQTHGVINSELTTRVGSTSACNVTTQDITIVHETSPSSVGINTDIETNASGFVTALKLTGSIRVDRGVPGAGTVVSTDTTTGVSGTLHIEEGENTYKVE